MLKRLSLLVAALFLLSIVEAGAQTASCTAVAAGTTQDITAHGVCKKVTFAGLGDAASVCAVTGTNGTEWASFYNNPPAGVTIAECAAGCAGGGYYYSVTNACYYWSNGSSASCDSICAGVGLSCNVARTKDIGADDTGNTRCAAVATALVGSAVSVSQYGSGDAGCFVQNYKGGWIGGNYNGAATTCGASGIISRICACSSGGSAPCNLPWGGQIAHGQSVTAWNTTSSCGGCASETRTCTNGSLSGSYQYSSCNNSDCGGYACASYNPGCEQLPNGNNGDSYLIQCGAWNPSFCTGDTQYWMCDGSSWVPISSCGSPPILW